MIRRATKSDKGDVVRMARDFHAASGLPVPFSAPMASVLFDSCISTPDRVCFVLDVNGRARGALAAHCGTHVFLPVLVSSEIMFWIDPEHRGGSGARRLMDAYEEWSRNLGCSICNMIGLDAEPGVSTLYNRCGYERVETHYMKNLQG